VENSTTTPPRPVRNGRFFFLCQTGLPSVCPADHTTLGTEEHPSPEIQDPASKNPFPASAWRGRDNLPGQPAFSRRACPWFRRHSEGACCDWQGVSHSGAGIACILILALFWAAQPLGLGRLMGGHPLLFTSAAATEFACRVLALPALARPVPLVVLWFSGLFARSRLASVFDGRPRPWGAGVRASPRIARGAPPSHVARAFLCNDARRPFRACPVAPPAVARTGGGPEKTIFAGKPPRATDPRAAFSESTVLLSCATGANTVLQANRTPSPAGPAIDLRRTAPQPRPILSNVSIFFRPACRPAGTERDTSDNKSSHSRTT